MSDLAELIESTRSIKRRLCMGPLNLSPDIVFKGEFLDVASLEDLNRIVLAAASPCPTEGSQCASILSDIIADLKSDPPRPDDRELCRRYCEGLIDARTVYHLTGWSPVRLFDECKALGLEMPDLYS